MCLVHCFLLVARRCFHADSFFSFFFSFLVPPPTLPLPPIITKSHPILSAFYIFLNYLHVHHARTLSPAQLLIESRGSRGHVDLEGHKSVESVVRPHKGALFIQKKILSVFFFFFLIVCIQGPRCVWACVCAVTRLQTRK